MAGVNTEPPDLPSSAPISGWEALTEVQNFHVSPPRTNGHAWCDFIAYTSVGINIQSVHFDPEFWHNCLLPKLTELHWTS